MKSMRDTRAIPQKQSVQTQKRKRSRWTRDDTELSILALPTTVWYALFCYLPMFGLVLAFKNYKISAGKSFVYSLFHSEWAGLDNFSFFLKSNQFATILRNTLLYNIVFIILGIVLPVGLAIMINNMIKKGVLQVVGVARCGRGYGRTYAPTLSQTEYAAAQALEATPDMTVSDRLLGVVAALVDKKGIDAQTIAELEQMLEEKRKELNV